MYPTLAVFAGALGLVIVGCSAWTAAILLGYRRRYGWKPEAVEAIRVRFFRWTYMDYAVLLVLTVGMLFLLADLLAVIRDREAYPFYHYGYLACGFVFVTVSTLFLFARFVMLLRFHHHEDQPAKSEHAENRIEEGQ